MNENGENSLIQFSNVSFTWPDPESGLISPESTPVFDSFSADIPKGFISLVGPNGAGKTSFMLLAGGRVLPQSGRIELLGKNTRILSGYWSDEKGSLGPGLTEEIEYTRNLVCSFLYQNMEFEDSGENGLQVGSLLEHVYENGGHLLKESTFYTDVIRVMELEKIQQRTLTALSKGEIQRVLLGFAALYGSKVIMMDEPVFAMEQYQKERTLEFFCDLYRRSGVSVIVSLHELSLTRKYADTVLLFYPDRRIDMGTCEEVLTKESLETAFGVPEAMLYDSERLTRKTFLETAGVLAE